MFASTVTSSCSSIPCEHKIGKENMIQQDISALNMHSYTSLWMLKTYYTVFDTFTDMSISPWDENFTRMLQELSKLSNKWFSTTGCKYHRCQQNRNWNSISRITIRLKFIAFCSILFTLWWMKWNNVRKPVK